MINFGTHNFVVCFFFSTVENLVRYGSGEIDDTCLKQYNNIIVMSILCVREREI